MFSYSSLGLAIPPRVRFLQRAAKRKEEQGMQKQKKKDLRELEDGQIPLESSAKTGKKYYIGYLFRLMY